MNIDHTTVTVRDLVTGYVDDDENGVTGYGGALDIRPPYQREFVYKDAQQRAVVDTVLKGLPLNTMYWVKSVDPATGEDHFEVLDGQQRTISLARFVTGGFSMTEPRSGATQFFGGLPADLQQQVLDYELQVYLCEGSDSERLAWFRTINVAGEKLTEQELLNANYPGRWLTDAKRFFSKTGGAGADLADGLVTGTPIRQELLAKVLAWIAARDGVASVDAYMAAHHDDKNAIELKNYFKAMVAWVDEYFPVRRKQMDGLDWGRLYNEHVGRSDLDPAELEAEIARLMADDEVQAKKGIYEYVLRGCGLNEKDLRLLNLRTFSEAEKATMYARQDGKCADPLWTGHDPDEVFQQGEMHADHVVPWSRGGRTELSNGQMLCAACNMEKKDK